MPFGARNADVLQDPQVRLALQEIGLERHRGVQRAHNTLPHPRWAAPVSRGYHPPKL